MAEPRRDAHGFAHSLSMSLHNLGDANLEARLWRSEQEAEALVRVCGLRVWRCRWGGNGVLGGDFEPG